MNAGHKRPRPESGSSSRDDGGAATTTAAAVAVAPPKSGDDPMSIFRPPALRSVLAAVGSSSAGAASSALTATPSSAAAAAAVLDQVRGRFTQTFELAAARVQDVRQISRYQRALTASGELLRLERVSAVVDAQGEKEEAEGGEDGPRKRAKCILLRPGVAPAQPETWSDVLRQGMERKELAGVERYRLTLGYEHWSSREILMAMLPEAFHDDIPTGFNTAGHVAHLNLRDRFQPFKYLVARVLLDKNAQLRTVINKTALVGAASAFRTFPYEVLAGPSGPDALQVQVRENGCTFAFDYAAVYWNSKLEREHTRLALGVFRPGQAVVDLMAGIGPFAVPAGRRGVFVWANDMNPASCAALRDAVARNRVAAYVRPFNADARTFVHEAADRVRAAAAAGESAPAPKAEGQAETERKKGEPAASGRRRPPPPPRPRVPVPPTVSHFVMNLPASALTFLPRFRGVYAGCEALFGRGESSTSTSTSTSTTPLPLVHVHCFAAKNETDPAAPLREVCGRVSAGLGVAMTLVQRYEEVEEAHDADDDDIVHRVYVHFVRAVAPHKSMFCASFRLPASVAFAPREALTEAEVAAEADAAAAAAAASDEE